MEIDDRTSQLIFENFSIENNQIEASGWDYYGQLTVKGTLKDGKINLDKFCGETVVGKINGTFDG